MASASNGAMAREVAIPPGKIYVPNSEESEHQFTNELCLAYIRTVKSVSKKSHNKHKLNSACSLPRYISSL